MKPTTILAISGAAGVITAFGHGAVVVLITFCFYYGLLSLINDLVKYLRQTRVAY